MLWVADKPANDVGLVTTAVNDLGHARCVTAASQHSV
jgi:hypothetical protein